MKNIILIIATGFGLGNSQILPGTLGTLLGIIPAIFLLSQSLILQIAYCFIIVLFGFLICDKAAKIIVEKIRHVLSQMNFALYQLLLLDRAQKQLVSAHSVTLLVQNMSVKMILRLDMVVQYVMEIYGMILLE